METDRRAREADLGRVTGTLTGGSETGPGLGWLALEPRGSLPGETETGTVTGRTVTETGKLTGDSDRVADRRAGERVADRREGRGQEWGQQH